MVRSSALVVRSAFHCEGGKAVKVKSWSPACSKLWLTAWQRSFHLRAARGPCPLHRRAAVGVNHVPVIMRQFLAQMGRGLGERVPQLVVGAALHRELRPLRLQRRGQSRIALNHRQRRSARITGGQRLRRVEPGLPALRAGQPKVENHAAAAGAYSQRDQHRHSHPLFPIRTRGYQPSKNR